jgi:hypothetical protein
MDKNKTNPTPFSAMEFISLALKNPEIREELDKFPPEFEEIFVARTNNRLRELILVLYHFVAHDAIAEGKVDVPRLIHDQVMWEFEYLKTESTRFKKKYDRNMIETINETKFLGNTDLNKQQMIDNAIFCLIKWDKTWLTVTTIRETIIDRQYCGDSTFFKRLGKIVAQKTDSLKKNNSNQHLFWLVERLGMALNLQDAKIRNRLHKIMAEQGHFNGSEDITPLSDLDYFNKQLKRHKII